MGSVTRAGEINLSLQLAAEVAKGNCKERSDMRYAFTGERLDCVCGQHVSPVPSDSSLVCATNS